jgi:hypothetical protein
MEIITGITITGQVGQEMVKIWIEASQISCPFLHLQLLTGGAWHVEASG